MSVLERVQGLVVPFAAHCSAAAVSSPVAALLVREAPSDVSLFRQKATRQQVAEPRDFLACHVSMIGGRRSLGGRLPSTRASLRRAAREWR
jgi:hypothetical protein